MKKSTVIYVLLAFFLGGVVYVTATLSTGRTTFFGKAAGEGVLNPANSYVFGSPLSAKSGGEKIRITIFALDGQGKGLPQKRVMVSCKDPTVCQNAQVAFSEVQPATDNLGQAIFDLTSVVPGKFELQASVEGGIIPQTVTVTFQ